jgi:tRNA 2-selenouridine synthase
MMFREIKYEEIDKDHIDGSYLMIDVRSPGEFKSETIPGAINIPVFTDEERVVIGTTYVQESMDKARQLGVEAAARKLPQIYEQVAKLDKEYNNLIFFCARGGFRSLSVTSLFRAIGINAIKLNGGYKGYRKYINDNLPKLVEEVKFIVLYGNTGSGKTEILTHLMEMGVDVLNLEDCANHRGSLLGGIGLGSPSTQKMFESLVYESLKNRKSNMIFTEGESKRIGRVIMPEYLFKAIKYGDNININTPMNIRVDNILKDYISETDDELIEALDRLKEHIGKKSIIRFTEMIKAHDYKPVIEELMVKYYDPMYEFKNREYVAEFENIDARITAEKIVHQLKPSIHRQA